jgi:hypothetical protein
MSKMSGKYDVIGIYRRGTRMELIMTVYDRLSRKQAMDKRDHLNERSGVWQCQIRKVG